MRLGLVSVGGKKNKQGSMSKKAGRFEPILMVMCLIRITEKRLYPSMTGQKEY